jgi:hypothetical protein
MEIEMVELSTIPGRWQTVSSNANRIHSRCHRRLDAEPLTSRLPTRECLDTFPSILRRTFSQQLFRSLRVLRGDPIGAGGGGEKV